MLFIYKFIYENYYKKIGFTKGYSYYSLKRLGKKDLLGYATKLTKEYQILVELKTSWLAFKIQR